MSEITDIQQAENYINTFNFYDIINGNKVELLIQFRICEHLAIENNHDKILCRTRTFILYLFIEENKLQEASELADLNLKFAKEKKLDDELLYMISIIAHLYQLTGNFSASEELIEIALDRIPTIQDDAKICKIYLMVAEQYFFTNNQEKCIEAYEKSLEYANKTTDNTLIAIVYSNYAESLLEFKLIDKALAVIEIGNKFATKSDNKFLITLLKERYGNYYTLTGEYKKAIDFILDALRFYKKSNNLNKEINLSIDLAKCYLYEEQFSKTFKLLQKLELLAFNSDSKKILSDTYRLFADYYEAKKQYQLAYDYLKKYNAIEAIIYNEDSENKINNLQITYEVKTIKQEREHAEKMARIKHDFLANMSHEIRTPINSILGICYLLQQDYLSDKQKQYVKRLNFSGENLLGIINDVLDISKIEAGKFNLILEPFSITQLIKNTHELMQLKSEEKEIQFKYTIDKNISQYYIGDMNRVNQVLLNLISNAIKFTKSGTVDLEVTLIKKEEQTATILFKLSDTGIGMSEAQLQKIFNEYEQATDSTQVKFGGTGLGLSIAKKLVELMNGKIEVESKENIGTTFKVYLPFEIPENEIEKTEQEVYHLDNLSDKFILIADDIEENRTVMAELILSINPSIKIAFAENGNAVLEFIKHQIPDIIMLDLDMPELNGFETVNYIQQHYKSHPMKIIACTASLLTLSKDELIELGFNDLLQKPFTIKQLMSVL